MHRETLQGLFDDDEEVRLYDVGLDLDEVVIDESDPETPTPDDTELESLSEEFEYFQVRCRNGCGMFNLSEANVKSVDVDRGIVEFRCSACNEFQTSDLLVVD